MSESYRNGSGDHNRIEHESKVHLWGHQSPITVDHTSYKFEHDPDLIVEIDLPYNKFPVRKSSAGIKRISSRSASAKSGSGTDRSLPSRGTPIKSRSRPMKPHETEPFLAVDAMTDRLSVTPTSNTARLPQRPTSSTVRKGRAPTVTGRLYAPDGRSPSPYINSGRNTPASSIYVSPTSKQNTKPNIHIKSPFKHSVQKTEASKDRASSPSQDLKELTAFATFHVGKMLSREPVEHRQKANGKLLKGKLKPLKPVEVKGPTIEKCKGIVSESRSSLPAPNRTLARRREILERIPNIHEFIYDRPRTEESIHRTSRASSVDENRDHIIKGESSDNDEELGRSSQVYQSDDLPVAATSSRTTNLGPTGPTPTPRMFVTEINNKGKENSPFDKNMGTKLTNGMELKKSGKNQDLPESAGDQDAGSKAERPSTAGKLVRFAEGSKDDPEASKDMKEQQNTKILEGQRENTVNTMSEEPTQMEMKVDITIIDKSESQKKAENKTFQGEIKILDKGEETNYPEKKKSKERCKPDENFIKKGDQDDDEGDNIKDKNDNRFVDAKSTSISTSQQAGSSQPPKKSGTSEKNGKQNSSHSCRSKERYKAPSTLQIQSVLHDGSMYYTVGAESPRRSPSPTRSPSPHSSKQSSDSTKSKHNRLIRPSSANRKTKLKRKLSKSSESVSSMMLDRQSPSPSRKVYFEGETPPRQSLFTEEKKGEEIEVTLRQDKEMTFDDLEQELVAIQESIHKRLETAEDNVPSNLDPDSRKTEEEDAVLKQVEGNILHLELNSKGQQADLELEDEKLKDSEQNYKDLLELYRKKCMTVSENCGCISDTLMTPRRADTPGTNRRHSVSRPSSACSRKSSSKKLLRRNSFHFERPSSELEGSGQKVLFKSPSVVSMTTDSGCSTGGDIEDHKIPSLCLLSATTDSDVCITDRSEEGKPLLEMVCDELPVDQEGEPGIVDRKQGSEDVEKDFQVVAKALEFSKPKHVKKQKKGPTAPFAPLCFTLNARPPAGYLYYFAYGPDMNQSRIATYLRREVKERFWGLLYGFQLVFNKKGVDIEAGGFANIEFNPFCSVEGVIYQITSEELELLDKHVGYPEHFTHLMLPVWMSNSLSPDQYGVSQYCVPAVMYIAQDKYINTNETINCDYALQQCIKSSDLVTPDYRDHMVNYCQPINEQILCVN